MLTDGRTTDARVTGILIAHLGAFGSGELKMWALKTWCVTKVTHCILLFLYFVYCYFNVCGVTLITGHLQKIDNRTLSKNWVSKALRHVPD